MLLEGSQTRLKKQASQSKNRTGESGSSQSRKVRAKRTIQEFTSLDNARDLINNVLKDKRSD